MNCTTILIKNKGCSYSLFKTIFYCLIFGAIIKAGILGGGQLGSMLLQAAANYPVENFILENDSDCPSAHLCNHFTKGNITNFEDVYNFGEI